MKRNGMMIAGAAGALMVVGAGSMVLGPAPETTAREAASAETFTVDPVHSMIFFRIRHLGVSYTYGRFNEPTGTYEIDLENPSSSMIDISVDAKNVDTGNEKRDDHLRSPDFFNVKQFPKVTFKSESFEKTGEDELKCTGTLGLHGTERPVEVMIKYVGEGETMQGYKSGFEANFEIKRSDFGMTKYIEGGALGDEVTLYVTIEGARN